MGFPRTVLLAFATLLLAGTQAKANTSRLKDALQTCALILNSTDRLTCFDGLAKSTASDTAQSGPAAGVIEPATKEPVTASEQRAARKEKRRAAEQRRIRDPNERVRSTYNGVVLRAWANGSSNYYVALTNGEVWKSDDHEQVRPVKDGEAVTLSPGAVGSWFMQFKTIKRPTIRVLLVD
jgi:hypothetical protein